MSGTIIYLLALSLFGLRVVKDGPVDKEMTFNVIVPAHNEEAVIAGVINSIKNANYPAEKINVTMVADFCTDGTAAIARDLGCDVFERASGARGKSAAVSEMIEKLRPSLGSSSVVVVFDADNLVGKDFFENMNRRLINGADVVQGNTGIHNWSQTVFTKLNHVNFAVTNRFKELARSQAGLSCRLRGHGMAFTVNAIDSVSWDASSLVEDQELTLKFVLAGFKVSWVHDAHVDSVIPATAAEARVQRQRWAGGKSEVTSNAVSKLLTAAFKNKSLAAFDLAVDYIMVSYAVQLAITGLSLLLALFFLGYSNVLTLSLFAISLVYFFYYLLASVLEGIRFGVFLCFFTAPVFIMWRLWIFVVSLRGAKAWH
ncbi:MAG: glycosyltransferase [Gammaproteobacteria bacterium]|nr:glycosyltransferase [Gammaproteobacteria bacterium]